MFYKREEMQVKVSFASYWRNNEKLSIFMLFYEDYVSLDSLVIYRNIDIYTISR